MNIKIITVGKLKEKYLKQGIAEYTKRLGSYCKLQIIEVNDEKAPENLSEKEMEMVKDKEGERILAKVTDPSYVFALAINGKQYDSVDFSKKIEQLGITGKSDIIFIIGGSLGLSKAVLQRANEEISFGKLTFPHQPNHFQ
ncbi:ribosomal RNA large subunit methyltransferase H [Enterococcus sp. DIV1314a]